MSKYGQDASARGKTKRTYGGIVYDSITEATYAAELDLRVRAGDIRSWRRQIAFKLEVGETFRKRYTIDFEIEHVDGRCELVEIKVKATMTQAWKLRSDLFRALYPDLWYTVVVLDKRKR